MMRPAFFATALITVLAACGAGESRPRAFERERSGAPLIAAWVVPYEDSLVSLERNADYLTVVSPTYFRLRISGLTATVEDWDPGVPFPRQRLQKLVTSGRVRKSSVLPMLGCIGPCGPQISKVLDNEDARSKHVRDLLELVKAQDLPGLFVDYEDVTARKESVSTFIHELAEGLHSERKAIGIVVQEPCGAGPGCKRTPYPFDLRTIADDVDVLAVMEYDYAVDGSMAPAPRKWVRAGMEFVAGAVSDSNRRKVICAVPLYGRATTGLLDDTAVLHADIIARRAGSKTFEVSTPAYDDEALAMVATLKVGEKSGKVYFENQATLTKRLALISELKLGGVALWRLGGEDPCISPELARFRGVSARAGSCGR